MTNYAIDIFNPKATQKKRDKKALDKEVEDIYCISRDSLGRHMLQNGKEVIDLEVSSEPEIAEVDSQRTKEIKKRLDNYEVLSEDNPEVNMKGLDQPKKQEQSSGYDKLPNEDESLAMLTKSNVTKQVSRQSALEVNDSFIKVTEGSADVQTTPIARQDFHKTYCSL